MPNTFILFVNYMLNVIHHSPHLMFVDDLKLYRWVDGALNAELLQRDLRDICRWCDINMFYLNIEKCYQITFARIVDLNDCSYKIKNIYLSLTNYVRNLGVLFDTKVTFKNHINFIVSKSLKQLGFVQWSADKCYMSTFKILCSSLLRSI